MTDQPAQQPTENVGRGALAAALAIPLGIVALGLVGWLLPYGYIVAVFSVAIPSVAVFLYTKAAGAPLSRKGWAPFIVITVIAVVLGSLSGAVAGMFQRFLAVGGDGGLLGQAFGSTLRNNAEDFLLFVGIGIALGVVGLVTALRNKNATGNRLAPGTFPGSTAAAAPAAPPAAPAAPTPPVPNAPSSGVILNGEPVDPDKK